VSIAETISTIWPPVSPWLGLSGIMLSIVANCSKPSPCSLVAVTVNGIPEMEKLAARTPLAVSVIRPAVTAPVSASMPPKRFQRTPPAGVSDVLTSSSVTLIR
jgi:hypothetical protein